MYVLVTVQAVTWWSNQSLRKQLRYIYSAWYITHPNYLRSRTHPAHLQKDTTIHNLPFFAQLSQSKTIKKQKGRTRDRTGIVGIKIRRDNHYPIRPRSFGISQFLKTWDYYACYAGLGYSTGDFLCLWLSWWCISREIYSRCVGYNRVRLWVIKQRILMVVASLLARSLTILPGYI